MTIKFCSVLFVFTLKILTTNGYLNLNEYNKMPPLHLIDDQEQCFYESNNNFQYCIAVTVIKPDNTSTVWNLIEKFSTDVKRNYRHDVMLNGLCIKWCEDKIKTSPSNELIYLSKFEYHHEYIDKAYHLSDYNNNNNNQGNESTDVNDFMKNTKLNLDHDVNKCVNMYLMKNYDLKGFSQNVYCKDHELMTKKFPRNAFDYLLITVFALNLILMFFVSVYDYFRDNSRESGSLESCLLCFSFQRNWKKFTFSNKSTLALELRCVQTIRFTFAVMIVCGHIVRDLLRLPTKSPEFFEEKYHHAQGMLTINGVHVVQTFFLIGGFMWALAFNEMASKTRKIDANLGLLAVLLRYLRLTPVFAICMLLQLSSLFQPQNIFLYKQYENEQENCRNNWWTNLLYMNNYYHNNKICMGHSWYLSADFQNAIVGVTLLVFTWKYPKYKAPILLSSITIATLIPTILTYTQRMSGIHFTPPEDYKYISMTKAWPFYIATHNNAGNYLIGLTFGAYFKKLKNIQFGNMFAKHATISVASLIALGLLPVYSSIFFYKHDFEMPAIWICLYVFCTKHFLGVILPVGVLIVIKALKLNPESFAIKFLNLNIFQILGRLTYTMYLVHKLTQPLLFEALGFARITNMTIFMLSIANICLTTTLAFILSICFEFPLTSLLKVVTQPVANKRNAECSTVSIQLNNQQKCKTEL